MTLLETPAGITPAFNEITYIDDTETAMTVSGVSPSREDSVTLKRVLQYLPDPVTGSMVAAARFDAKAVVSTLFIDRRVDINTWACHEYNLKALYYTSLDGTQRIALNAVHQIGEPLDMYTAGNSAVLTNYAPRNDGRHVIPTYEGFPVGATIMAKKWYELNLDDAFEFVVKATANTAIAMNVANTSAVLVVWGDGTIERYSGATKYQLKHTYSTTSSYKCSVVAADGAEYWGNTTVSGLASQNMHQYMGPIIQWGKLSVCRLQDSTQVTSIPSGAYPGTLTTVEYMFNRVYYMASPIPANFFVNVAPGITSLQYLFNQCGQNDTSQTTVRSITGNTFRYFPEASNLSSFMNAMTNNSHTAAAVPLDANLFQYMRKVTNVSQGLALNCVHTIPANLLAGMSTLTNVTGLFSGFHGASVPNDIFKDCVNVTNAALVYGIGYYTSVGVNALRGLTNVTNISQAFTNTPTLTTVPVGLFTPTPNVTNIGSIFARCGQGAAPLVLPDGLFAPLTKVTSVFQMLHNAYVGHIDSTLFYYMTALKSFESAFHNMQGTAGVTKIGPNTIGPKTGVTTVVSMFEGCTNTTVEAGALTTLGASVTDMRRFAYKSSGVTFAAGAWDAWTQVANMSYAFYQSTYMPPAGAFNNATKVSNIDQVFAYNTATVATTPFGTTSKPLVTTCTGVCTGMPNLTTQTGDMLAPFINCRTIRETYQGATKLTSIPESLFAGCPNATVMANVLMYTAITIPAKLFYNNKLVTDFSRCFMALNAGVNQVLGTSPVTNEGYKLWERAGKAGYPATINGNYAFNYQTKLTDIASVPSPWKTA